MIRSLWLRQIQRRLFAHPFSGPQRRNQQLRQQRRFVRLQLEGLEERVMPTVFNIANGDVTGLITAINTANTDIGPDTINLATNGTYTFTTAYASPLGLTNNGLPIITANNLTINGNGASLQRSSVSGTAKFRILEIDGSTTINDLTIAGGNSGLNNGGGIYVVGTLNLNNSNLRSNTTGSDGGGLAVKGTLSMNNGIVSGNTAGSGGGITDVSGGTVSLFNSIVSSNTADNGGGVFVSGVGTVNLNNTSVGNNTAAGGFGGGIDDIGGTVELSISTTVRGNTAGTGGGISVLRGTVNLTSATVSGNTATSNRGGGVYGTRSAVRLTFSTVSGNTAFEDGGGVSEHEGSLFLFNSTVSGNTANSNGGGVFDSSGGSVNLTASTVNNNTAAFDGGGLSVSGKLNLINSTIANNTAGASFSGGNGGGLIIFSGSTATINDSTIAFNQSLVSGPASGGIDNDFGVLTLVNSIVADNRNESGGSDLVNEQNLIGPGGSVNATTNLIQNVTGVILNGTNLVGPQNDPQLRPLQNNGGFTETLSIPTTSAAFGFGDTTQPSVPSTDQRGFARVVSNKLDLGAFQIQAGQISFFPPSVSFSSVDQKVNLSVEVTAPGFNNVNEGSVTFTVLGQNVTALVSTSFAFTTLTIPGGTLVTSYPITIVYNDPNDLRGSSITRTFVIQAANTTTTITSTPINITYNSTTAQTVTLSATVTSSGGGPVNEGAVTFTVVDPKGVTVLTATANVINGVATTTPLAISAGFLAATYAIHASYADTPNIDGNVNYNPSSSATPGTLTVNAAATTTILTSTSVSSTFNSITAQTVTLSAMVTSIDGGTVNEGAVTFTVVVPNGTDLTAKGNVLSGAATTMLTLPPGFLAGTYVIDASYTDTPNSYGNVNYSPSPPATPGTLTVKAATTTTTLTATPFTSIYNSDTPQSVTLTASVTWIYTDIVFGVNEGVVTFTVTNPNEPNLTAKGTVVNGTATATLMIPAGYLAGPYSISAAYADNLNGNGVVNYLPSTTATPGKLTINPAETATTITSTSVNGTFSGASQSVTLTASVTSFDGGTVREGNVTFTVANPNGAALTTTGAVVNGTVTATLTIPAGFSAGTYSISAAYADILNTNGVVNYLPSTFTSSTLTEHSLPTSVSVSNVSVPFTSADPTITLKAAITTQEGPAQVGQVQFVVTNSSGSVIGQSVITKVSNGQASASFAVPAETPLGAYTITAMYSDPAGNLAGSSGSGTLTIVPSSTTVVVKTVNIVYGLMGEQETLTAVVFNALGLPVNEGFVTFTDSGQTATVPLVDSLATATLNIPLMDENPFAHSIPVAYRSNTGNFLASTGTYTTQSTLMNFLLQMMAVMDFLARGSSNGTTGNR